MRHPWSGDCFDAHTIVVLDAHDRSLLASSHGRRVDSTAFATQGRATRRGRHAREHSSGHDLHRPYGMDDDHKGSSGNVDPAGG